ncbi:hypothetical protein QR680_017495 [Steinernema hermaphroditum]|uniref:UV radiation resistance associated protein n=1 Tax=Steinernema hermaphroditum TaxID=289476 RepID=A0AA39HES5_9BILA|nr:hypothetical protein QR680_017495 [Steinernema hermaphroditum]
MRDGDRVSSAPSLLRASTSALRISTSSASVSSTHSRNSSQLISETNFTKLRNLSVNIREQREVIRRKRERIEGIIHDTDNFRDEADIESKKVEIAILQQKYNKSLNSIRMLTQARDDLLSRSDERDSRTNDLEVENQRMQEKVNSCEQRCQVPRESIRSRGADLVLRRRLMIRELYELFTIEVDRKVDFKLKRPCTCFSLDLINNLHLPYTNCLIGHSDIENEVVTAVGHVVHMLSVLSVILDHPLRYPVQFESSRSCVFDNVAPEKFVLSKIRSRSDRYHFEKGLELLGKNVAQIRSDCGLPCAKPERILFNLKELLLHLAGHARIVPKHKRPTLNAASPSSLLLVPKQLPPDLSDVLDPLEAAISPIRWREASPSDMNLNGHVVLSPSKRNAFCYSSYSVASQASSAS